VGGVEQEADLLAEVDELEAAAFPARGAVESGESAETHAVHADEIGEVEDDALVIQQQRPDLVVEYVADTGHGFAMQSDDDGVRVAVDVQRQGGRRRGVGVVRHGQFIVVASSSLSRGDQQPGIGTVPD
jgi:hypothetical protein